MKVTNMLDNLKEMNKSFNEFENNYDHDMNLLKKKMGVN